MPFAARSLLAVLALGACQATPDAGAFDWCHGTWHGVRRDGASGGEAEMTMRVEPLVGGAGHMRVLEIQSGSGAPYCGVAVQFVDGDGRWLWQYSNGPGRAFARDLGPLLGREGTRVEWTSASSRRRRSVLVSERRGEVWRRTMRVSDDDGATWRELWSDELRRYFQE